MRVVIFFYRFEKYGFCKNMDEMFAAFNVSFFSIEIFYPLQEFVWGFIEKYVCAIFKGK